MCSIVFGEGLPLKSAIVTSSLPIATPFSNSNSLAKPRTRSNQSALFFGLRTARPKWPTTPSLNGTFTFIFQKNAARAKTNAFEDDCVGINFISGDCRDGARHD